MRILTIPNQSSIAKAFAEFDEPRRAKPSSHHERVVDVIEELLQFTLLTQDVAPTGRALHRAATNFEITQ